MADNVDEFKARARAMREGLEPELSVAMDVMYPMEALTRAAAHSRKTYPHTPLRLYVEALGGVIKPVLDRNCSIGVIGSLPLVPDELQSEPLLEHSIRDRRQSRRIRWPRTAAWFRYRPSPSTCNWSSATGPR